MLRLVARVPFADVAGGLTFFLEQLGQQPFVGMWSFGITGDQNPCGLFRPENIEADAPGITTGEQRGARGRADRGGRVEIREARPFFGKPVDVRSVVDPGAVATEVALARVVHVE